MSLDLPDFFIESLNQGEVNVAISKALAKTNLKKQTLKANVNYETIVSLIKGYLAFKFLLNKSDVERFAFYKLICSEYVVAGLIDEFKDVVINTGKSDKEIMDTDAVSRVQYLQLLFNQTSDLYKKLDKYDEFILKETKKYIDEYSLDITAEELTKLIKCDIVSEMMRYGSDSEDFDKYWYISDIIPNVYQLRKEAMKSTEDKFATVSKDKMIFQTVQAIVDNNSLDGRCL